MALESLLAVGHTTLADLESLAEHDTPAPTNGESHTNGTVHKTPLLLYKEAINHLVDAGLIRRFRNINAMPALDAQGIVERQVAWDNPAYKPPIAGPKKEKEFAKLSRDYKRMIRDEDGELREPPVVLPETQSVENVDEPDEGVRRKRRKLNDGRGYGQSGQDEYEVEPIHLKGGTRQPWDPSETLYHVDTDKLDVFLRTELLIDLCNRTLGEVPAQVYATILDLLEKEMPRCFDDLDDTTDPEYRYADTIPSVTSKEVAQALDRNLDLAQEQPSKTPAAPSTRAAGPIDPQRIHEVDLYLRMLAEHPTRLLTRTTIAGASRWKVNFRALTLHLIQAELEAIIAARWGPLGARIVRILGAKGRLDEKQLAQLGLCRQRELRHTLTAMQAAGFVDTQEVPRDASRQPSRTIYLWAWDASRARTLVLDDSYKAMARLLQRAAAEKVRLRGVIDKAERSDVRGREEQLLSAAEREALRGWAATEERLLVQLGRQDELVAILRDFLPAKGDA